MKVFAMFVYLRAFAETENQLMARLAANLFNEEIDPDTIALVAVVGSEVVGHIAFSPVTADVNKNWLGCILASLGVKPECH